MAKRPKIQAKQLTAYWHYNSHIARYTHPFRCSRCGRKYDEASNFCPNCGAKMDKQIREENDND